MSRKGVPPSESLWDDLPDEEGSRGSNAGSIEPPSWALPSWDAVPAEPTAAPARPQPRRPEPASRPEAPARTEAEAEREGFGLRILQVSDVTRVIRDALRTQPALRDVWVEGEVGRVTVSSAGHAYFTLKDDRSQLACVFFRDDRVNSPFEPRTGLRVVAHGRVDLFETQGVYQLYVASIQPAGFGDLALRFEALKARLAAEGLFDSSRKRPLPVRPALIGVATSASGAVWHDICHVLSRRWPLTSVVLSPCRVQGDGAAQSVVAALDRLARWGERCRAEGRPQEAPQVVILARGGGSLEDLWPFNDERVVRAVVAHPVPVICGVGHEVDVTLADFAADVRAPTPSAAAELVVPDRSEIAGDLTELMRRAAGSTRRGVVTCRAELAAESRALESLRPLAQLAQARERAGYLLDRATGALRADLGRRSAVEHRLAVRLEPALQSALARRRLGLERAAGSLGVVGPQATLDRGYAIVRKRDGAIVRRPAEAPAGEKLGIRVAQGEFEATSDGASDAAQGKGPAKAPGNTPGTGGSSSNVEVK